MRKKIVLLLIGIFLLSVIPSTALAKSSKFEFEVRHWQTNLTLTSKVSSSNFAGSELDFKRDLNIKEEDVVDWRIAWHPGTESTLRLSFMRMFLNGNNVISQNMHFGGKTFSSGSRVLTEFNVRIVRLAWIWQFIDEKDFKIGPLLEVRGLFIDTALESPGSVSKQSDSLTAAIPVIGVAIDTSPFEESFDFIGFFGEISGLYIDENQYGYTYDIEAGVRVTPFEHLSIIGGYRVFVISAEDEPDFARFKLNGPFFGAKLEF